MSENWRIASQGLSDNVINTEQTIQRLDLLEKRFLRMNDTVENLVDDVQYFGRLGRENLCLMQEKYLIIHETLTALEVQYSTLEDKFGMSYISTIATTRILTLFAYGSLFNQREGHSFLLCGFLLAVLPCSFTFWNDWMVSIRPDHASHMVVTWKSRVDLMKYYWEQSNVS